MSLGPSFQILLFVTDKLNTCIQPPTIVIFGQYRLIFFWFQFLQNILIASKCLVNRHTEKHKSIQGCCNRSLIKKGIRNRFYMRDMPRELSSDYFPNKIIFQEEHFNGMQKFQGIKKEAEQNRFSPAYGLQQKREQKGG